MISNPESIWKEVISACRPGCSPHLNDTFLPYKLPFMIVLSLKSHPLLLYILFLCGLYVCRSGGCYLSEDSADSDRGEETASWE